MENKLQQLTQKLYDEGLEKGRAEAERLVAEAKTNAAKIVKEAEAQAAKILAEANTKAQDVEKNAMTEISLAGKQALSKIKAEISSMIIAKSTAPAVKAATLDPEFVKQMLLTVAKNWSGADSSKNQLKALLPEAWGQGTQVIGNVARFCEAKDHPGLLRAFAAVRQTHPAARLLLVGDGPVAETVRSRLATAGLV